MERKTIEYLDPQEQLRVGALVGRLCEVAPEEFDSENHVEVAREIVKALDPKIEATKSRFTVSVAGDSKSESSVMSGATDQGNVSASFEETKKWEARIGKILEYRIGMYVATGRNKKGNSNLYFQHFWDRGEISDVFEREQPTTEITYRQEDLEPILITRLIPNYRSFGIFTVVTYQRIGMWRAK